LFVFAAAGLQGQHPLARTLGESEGLPSAQVRGLAEDATGSLWILGRSTLSIFDGRNLIPAPRIEGFEPEELGHLARDEEQVVWVVSAVGPPTVASYRQGRWEIFSKPGARSDDRMMTLLARVNGGHPFVAVGTAGGRLHLLRQDRWRSLGRADGLPRAAVNALAGDEKALFLGTDDGLQVLQGGKVQAVVVAGEPRLQEPILALKEMAGEKSRLAVLGNSWFGVFDSSEGRFELSASGFDLQRVLPFGLSWPTGSIVSDGIGGVYFGDLLRANSRSLSTKFSVNPMRL